MPTRGSLTKAGKVRSQTPKIQGKPRISLISKIRNKIRITTLKDLKKDVNRAEEAGTWA